MHSSGKTVSLVHVDCTAFGNVATALQCHSNDSYTMPIVIFTSMQLLTSSSEVCSHALTLPRLTGCSHLSLGFLVLTSGHPAALGREPDGASTVSRCPGRMQSAALSSSMLHALPCQQHLPAV